jgi:ligand-binding sensor domain-containing protein
VYYVSSFSQGLEERNALGSVKIYNESNSPLVNSSSPSGSIAITAIESAKDGLWVANYGAPQPLHFLAAQDTWQSYSFSVAAARYPMELAVDLSNNIWAILNPAQGGGVLIFNREKGANRYLTNVNGSGGLPSKAVRSVAVDRSGTVWLGTDEGVCYFSDTDEVLLPGMDANKPIFENRFLLRDDKVTAIAVDGGNRKWIGTERGIWLFGPTGETLVYNFTAQNSPLPSNTIRDIEINAETGEVFFATDQGIVSFRADATESAAHFAALKIFPNPVTPNFEGTVGISGLATDAVVKIVDISGKLIWETQANGGTASWNIRDREGKRAQTGVYLVFSASVDGAETVVGKIAVIE